MSSKQSPRIPAYLNLSFLGKSLVITTSLLYSELMKTWHYADQENRPKQISDAEIQPLVNSGEIGPQTRLWTEG
ncbi:DUF4339 domain-containing protein, partial [Akkermansiaceae bacterium]|nr:DUF4339 domain-containing protein [Akkermansiaceae bacterium]